ncbi:MAG: hypothetical protein ABL956_06625 [Hyphomonadaceae bacterium]
MVTRKQAPIVLTVAAVGLGVGIGMWLMRERIRSIAGSVRDNAHRANNPLDVFGTDVPDNAFEGVANYPHVPEGWRPRRGARD